LALQSAWQAAAEEVVLSWPTHEDDTKVDRSLLVPSLPALDTPPAFADRARLQLSVSALETVADDVGPPLAAARASVGARVRELQSSCPFRAFGELRLKARPLEEPQTGFDRRLRGQALHRALESLWSGLASQSALLALTPAECDRRVSAAVDAALADVAPDH